MHSISLYPLLIKPTRITPHSAIIIDNILTSQINDTLRSGLIVDDITDHLPIFTLYNLGNLPQNKKHLFICRRKFINDVNAVLCETLDNTCWDLAYESKYVATAYDGFYAFLKNKLTKICLLTRTNIIKQHNHGLRKQ